jgi:hypothetical protein
VGLVGGPERAMYALVSRFPPALLLNVPLEVLQLVVAPVAVLASVAAQTAGPTLPRVMLSTCEKHDFTGQSEQCY